MSLTQHLSAVCDLMIAWEAELQGRLGYLPPRFQECCRAHLDAYLSTIDEELAAERSRVRLARERLQLVGAVPRLRIAATQCVTEKA